MKCKFAAYIFLISGSDSERGTFTHLATLTKTNEDKVVGACVNVLKVNSHLRGTQHYVHLFCTLRYNSTSLDLT